MLWMQLSLSDELSELNMPDQRLERRAKKIAEDLSSRLNETQLSAHGSWADAMGAYRFWSNERVDAEKLLSSHKARSLRRASSAGVVRCVEDTTIFDFFGRPEIEGLGPLNKDYQHGFLCHAMLAFDPRRECLGLLNLKCWARSEGLGERARAKAKPIEQKESFRWLEGFRKVEALAGAAPQTQWVYIADREADIFDLYYERTAADYVIRARFDRKTEQAEKMLAQVEACESLGTWEVEVPPRLKRPEKKICVQVKAASVSLVAPWRPSRRQRQKQFPEPCKMNVVLVEELKAPGGETPVKWVLLTTLPAGNLEQAREVAEHYRCRWEIEIFFRTLKSGCRYEELQLKSFEKLKRALSIYSLVAWRIMVLKQAAQARPQDDCSGLFSKQEWQAIWRLRRKRPPQTPPSIKHAITELACLGGYLNRANDPPPGPQVIWKGLKLVAPLATILAESDFSSV